jgi:hypothetical protein
MIEQNESSDKTELETSGGGQETSEANTAPRAKSRRRRPRYRKVRRDRTTADQTEPAVAESPGQVVPETETSLQQEQTGGVAVADQKKAGERKRLNHRKPRLLKRGLKGTGPGGSLSMHDIQRKSASLLSRVIHSSTFMLKWHPANI